VEYNDGSILVRLKHPLDECLRRDAIEQQHRDSGKRIMTIRDGHKGKSYEFAAVVFRGRRATRGGQIPCEMTECYANLGGSTSPGPAVARGVSGN
jgi:hypothetical protein